MIIRVLSVFAPPAWQAPRYWQQTTHSSENGN